MCSCLSMDRSRSECIRIPLYLPHLLSIKLCWVLLHPKCPLCSPASETSHFIFGLTMRMPLELHYTRSFVCPPVLISLLAPQCLHSRKGGSSLEGQRSIAEFFHILDYLIEVVNSDDYKLQRLDDNHCPLASPPVERSSPGNIVAGNYVIGKSPLSYRCLLMLTTLQSLRLKVGRSCPSSLIRFSTSRPRALALRPREKNSMEQSPQ